MEDDMWVLKDRMTDKQAQADNYWRKWQSSQLNGEEAMLRLHFLWESMNEEMDIKKKNAAAYEVLENKQTRSSRLMTMQGKEKMKVTFKANNKENLFYAFVGFVYILSEQKAERERKEQEARRDAVEFSLKSEVKFLISEIDRRQESVQSLAEQTQRLKHDRRLLGG